MYFFQLICKLGFLSLTIGPNIAFLGTLGYLEVFVFIFIFLNIVEGGFNIKPEYENFYTLPTRLSNWSELFGSRNNILGSTSRVFI